MGTTALKRNIAFPERIYLTVFSLLVGIVVSVHDMIPHSYHGIILTCVVKSLGENVESYFNHHPAERFEVFENVCIKHSEWTKITVTLLADTGCCSLKDIPKSQTEEIPYGLCYASTTVGVIQLRAPPFV